MTDASDALRAAGVDLGRQREELGAAIATASEGQPWGDDEYGEAFDRRYREVEQQVLGAWQQLAGFITHLGEKS